MKHAVFVPHADCFFRHDIEWMLHDSFVSSRKVQSISFLPRNICIAVFVFFVPLGDSSALLSLSSRAVSCGGHSVSFITVNSNSFEGAEI